MLFPYSDLNTDIDDLSENENDLVDHDDPPYQAPPLMVLDQESSDRWETHALRK